MFLRKIVAEIGWLHGGIRYTPRLREVLLTEDITRLHATKYPWEHEKWIKTFDHQASVNTVFLDFSIGSFTIGYVVDSEFTAKFAPPATLSNVFHGA